MRQASTEDWPSFYQFRLVRGARAQEMVRLFMPAVLYTALSVPIATLKTVPEFLPQISPKLAELLPLEALQFAKSYYFYFYAAFALLTAYPAPPPRGRAHLRFGAARLHPIRRGAEDALAENEWETLHRLDLLAPASEPAAFFCADNELVGHEGWPSHDWHRAVSGLVRFCRADLCFRILYEVGLGPRMAEPAARSIALV